MKQQGGLKRIQHASLDDTYKIFEIRYGAVIASWLIKEIKKTEGGTPCKSA